MVRSETNRITSEFIVSQYMMGKGKVIGVFWHQESAPMRISLKFGISLFLMTLAGPP